MSESSYNKNIKTTASVLGVFLAISGIVNHAIFEILQGNKATNGMFIEAIGEEHRFWVNGTEGAFTLIPNFLFTGIVAATISLVALIWSAKYLHIKNGVKILLLLFILMLLTGGGIGFLFIFIPTWLYATRIHSNLTWWNKILSERVQMLLAKVWPLSLIITLILWLTIMELGIFGYFPGQSDPDALLNMVMLFLLGAVVLVNITFISAISKDLQNNLTNRQ